MMMTMEQQTHDWSQNKTQARKTCLEVGVPDQTGYSDANCVRSNQVKLKLRQRHHRVNSLL